jgi:hypothetical protein
MPSSKSSSKRSLPPEKPSSSKRIRTRSSRQVPPTPDDDQLSDALSRLSAAGRNDQVPADPANPGIIRTRGKGSLSRLPADSDALETFADGSSRQVPPTPDDDQLSDALSRLSSAGRNDRVPVGPANPGIIRTRGKGPLSRLPVDSDALETFANLRRDGELSDEEALLKLITTYDVSLSTLHQISCNIYPTQPHRRITLVIMHC